ncbi:MAG TPA: hypothetical protein VGP33_04625 [Chloroflexota bacterium]|nr:hypothetical protein [Chloroflexota bacterium]
MTGTNVGVAAGAVLATLAALDVAGALVLAAAVLPTEEVVLAAATLPADDVIAAVVVAAVLVVVEAALLADAAELVTAVVAAELDPVTAATVPLLVVAVLVVPQAAKRGTAAASTLALSTDLRVIEAFESTASSKRAIAARPCRRRGTPPTRHKRPILPARRYPDAGGCRALHPASRQTVHRREHCDISSRP